MMAPVESCNSRTGSASAPATPKSVKDGPIARMTTNLGSVPLMMKPPIPTLVPVSTSTRVERLRALFGGVGVEWLTLGLGLGAQVGWGSASEWGSALEWGRSGGRRNEAPLEGEKVGISKRCKGFGYAVLRKLHDITSASVSDKDITLVAAADQFRKKCEAIRILQNRIRRELTEGSVGEDHLNNVLVRRNENKVFTRQIWNDCHGSGIAAQIHRSPDLDTVRIEGRNEGLVRDDNIPIDEIDAAATGAVTVMNGVLVPLALTLVIALAPFSPPGNPYRRRQDRWDSRNPTQERSWFRPE